MFTFHKPLEDLEIADIQALVENKVPEDKTLDYKLELPGNKDKEKKEFLGDVASFANTSGGFIIFGIQEEKGIPTSIEGFESEDIDKDIQRLEQIIRTGIEPRIIGYKIKYLELGDNKYILILQIPKSLLSPHWVSFKQSYKFYGRATTGKYYMTLEELRLAFNESSEISQRFAEFRAERISKIYNDDIEVGNLYLKDDEIYFLLHFIPINALTINGFKRKLNLNNIQNKDHKLRPPVSAGWNIRYTLEGFYTFTNSENNLILSYSCLFYNGIIEAFGKLNTEKREQLKLVNGGNLESHLLRWIFRYLTISKELNINSPLIASITILNAKSLVIKPKFLSSLDVFPNNTKTALIPETIIEDLTTIPYLGIPNISNEITKSNYETELSRY